MEEPPASLEKNEQEYITDEQCTEAMRRNDWERAAVWQDQESRKVSDADPTQKGRTEFAIRFARMKLSAGFSEKALDTLDDAHWDAMQQGDYEAARQLEDEMDQLKNR